MNECHASVQKAKQVPFMFKVESDMPKKEKVNDRQNDMCYIARFACTCLLRCKVVFGTRKEK